MSKMVMGYVGTIAGAIVALLALASIGESHPNYLVSAILTLLAMVLLGVGWYGLRVGNAEAQKEAA